MNKEVVCAEDELKMASNSISTYGDFLASSIEDYIVILQDIRDISIKDYVIDPQLDEAIRILAPMKENIEDECKAVTSSMSSYISEIEKADNFQFPNEVEETIKSIVSMFM